MSTTPTEAGRPPARLYDPVKLRAWREQAHLSREQVCTQLGISYPWLAALEQGPSGDRQPSLQLLTQLAQLYGHQPGELLEVPA